MIGLVTISKLRAQDVENIVKDAQNTLRKEAVSVTGSIGANTVLYKPIGIAPRRDPAYWVLNANLNFTLFNKVLVPFSAVITQQDKNYTNGIDRFSQPFNQFGLSPKYRWLTVHAGYRTLDFSEYTMHGAMFLGGGVEVKPEKTWISGTAFYGRFVKAIPLGGADGIVVSVPSYGRFGGGAKVRIGSDEHNGEFIFLKIKDNIHSLPFDTTLNVSPVENLILSANGKTRLYKRLMCGIDIAFSMYTKNLYSDLYTIDRFTYINQIFQTRTSSEYNKALTAFLNYEARSGTYGIKYKRIDPSYRTLGSIFLTNDLEEISLNSTSAVFRKKATISLSLGLQTNNLDRAQMATSKRIVAATNVSYNLNDHLNFSANYSSFSSNTLPVRDAFADSIRFVQITQNTGFMCNYSFGNTRLSHIFTTTFAFQEGNGTKQVYSNFRTYSFAHSMNLQWLGLALNTSMIYNSMYTGGFGLNEGFGPQLGISKTLINNKLRLSLAAGYQDIYLSGIRSGKNMTASYQMNFTMNKHHSIRSDLHYLKRSVETNNTGFEEIRLNVGYLYTFGFKSKSLIK